MSRITDILKDEESLRQLSELVEMLKSGDTGEVCGEQAAPENTGDMPDMELMMKLSGLAGAMNSSDKNTELLLALRPHLRVEKQRRLDKAVKMLKLLSVYDAAKESGLINNLI